MTVCLVFDIDDTIYIHKNNDMNYDIIRPDYQMKSLLQRIKYPKFILTFKNLKPSLILKLILLSYNINFSFSLQKFIKFKYVSSSKF